MTHEQSLRNFDSWKRSLRNFDWLKGAAPGAMDLDFFCERKGSFLIMEGKPWTKGIWLGYGQHLALYRASQLDEIRVYLVGEGSNHFHVMCYDDAAPPRFVRKGQVQAFFPPERFIPTTRDGLSTIVSAWWADAGGPDV